MTHLKVVEEIQDGGMLVTRKTTILRLIFVCKIKSTVLLVLRNFSSLYLIFSFPQEKLIKLLVTNAIGHM